MDIISIFSPGIWSESAGSLSLRVLTPPGRQIGAWHVDHMSCCEQILHRIGVSMAA
jgi:hypothetical protein